MFNPWAGKKFDRMLTARVARIAIAVAIGSMIPEIGRAGAFISLCYKIYAWAISFYANYTKASIHTSDCVILNA